MDVRFRLWRKLSTKELMLLNCGVGEDSWESLGLQGDPTSPFWRRSALGFLWKEWCWSWNSSTLATSCEELTHWKRLWGWEGFGAGGEGDDRGWDGWMASLTWCMWVWVNSGSWWRTGWPGVLRHGVAKSRTWLSDWTDWLSWQLVKNPPAMQETPFYSWVRKFSWERDRLPAPVILPEESPWTEKPRGLQSIALQRVGTTDWLSTAQQHCTTTNKLH